MAGVRDLPADKFGSRLAHFDQSKRNETSDEEMKRARLILRCFSPFLFAVVAAQSASAGIAPDLDPVLWPEQQRAFFQDGPALLISAEDRVRFQAMDDAGRQEFLDEFLSQDPDPSSLENELHEGIQRRQRMRRETYLSVWDDRAKVLFLHGEPSERVEIECGQTFKLLEIWRYGVKPSQRELVFYQPHRGQPYRLWIPPESKRVMYNREMEYWLQQWEELRGRIRAKRFDLQTCPETRQVDKATGVAGLSGYLPGRPTRDQVLSALAPPDDLTLWAKEAAREPISKIPQLAGLVELKIVFPEQINQRMVTRFQATIPAGTKLETTFSADKEEAADQDSERAGDDESEGRKGKRGRFNRGTSKKAIPADDELDSEARKSQDPNTLEDDPSAEATLSEESGESQETEAVVDKKREPKNVISVEGLIEQDGKVFEEFKVRFKIDPRTEEIPVALVFERLLRPGRSFVVHIRVRDDVAGAETYLSRGFVVPMEPQVVEEPAVPESAMIALGEQLERTRFVGKDSLILIPPESDVVLNLWRAEALVTGERIQKVQFYVDDQRQLTRNTPPFTAELRLAKFPTEQIIRAEGHDEKGELVDFDEIILNQPRGALSVTILEPRRGVVVSGTALARAEIVVPDGRTIHRVEFSVNDETVASLDAPPWQASIEVPPGGTVAYLTISATLDDGSRAEDVRFLNAPQYLEQVEVKLVELYTTVVDRNGRLIRDLTLDDFEVFEDERPQEITKFELVDDLPLTIGITIDTSGSMVSSLPQAEKAAIEFLRKIMTEQDRAFAVSFANSPVLLIPPTDDVRAVEEALTDLQSLGWTTLHDAVVTSLYYFRGIRGRRAMILLSDGDDTGSSIPFRDALEYARRSGVMVYSVGLDVGAANIKIRRKLTQLAVETGGQSFFIHEASELSSVYRQIEEDLRSQYLLAYSSDRPTSGGDFRTVKVKVKRGKLKARTISGYFP